MKRIQLGSSLTLALGLLLTATAVSSPAAHAQQFCGSGQNGGSMQEYPYLLNNNKFGANQGGPNDYNCITEKYNSYDSSNGVTYNGWESDWSWTYNASSQYSVKAFPSLVLGWQYGYTFSGTGLPSQISAGRNVNTYAELNLYGTQHQDVIYDNWILNSPNASAQAAEVEIYLTNSLGQTNACNGYGINEGDVTIDGTSYCLNYRPAYYNGGGNAWPIYSFENSNSGSVNQSLNIKDFVNYLTYTKGYLSANQYIGGTQLGIEPYYGTGGVSVQSSAITVQ